MQRSSRHVSSRNAAPGEEQLETAESLAHRCVLRGIHDLSRERFVEETTRLLLCYLKAEAPEAFRGR